MKDQSNDDSERKPLPSKRAFPQPRPLDDGESFALPLEPDCPKLDGRIQSIDLAQLLAQAFHPQSTRRGSFNIDAIGHQMTWSLTHRLGGKVYFSASHRMPRHFSANLLSLKKMLSLMTSRIKALDCGGKPLLLTCQWSATEKRLSIVAMAALSDRVLAVAHCPDCTPLDNRFPQQNLRALVSLKDPFDAMIVKRWVLRQGIALAQHAEPGPMLHISEGAIVQFAPNPSIKDRQPSPRVIARVNHPTDWLSDIEQTVLTTFKGETADRHRSGVTVIHSFDTDPNQSPLIRLLLQSQTKFRIATQHGTLGRQQLSIPDPILIDFTPDGATHDGFKMSQTGKSWPKVIFITRSPSAETIGQENLSIDELAKSLTELSAEDDLTHILSKALNAKRAGVDPTLPIPTAKTGERSARLSYSDQEVSEALIFDEQLALIRAGGNKALALELKAVLRTTLQEDLFELVTSVRTHDLEQARKILHKMAGGLAMTGAPKLEEKVKTAYLELSDEASILKLNAVIIQSEQLLTILSQSRIP